jgi:hypothetical protein
MSDPEPGVVIQPSDKPRVQPVAGVERNLTRSCDDRCREPSGGLAGGEAHDVLRRGVVCQDCGGEFIPLLGGRQQDRLHAREEFGVLVCGLYWEGRYSFGVGCNDDCFGEVSGGLMADVKW